LCLVAVTGCNKASNEGPKAAQPAKQQVASGDIVQQAADNFMRVNSGRGACQNIGLQMQKIAYGGGPMEGRFQVVSSMLNQAQTMGCQTNW